MTSVDRLLQRWRIRVAGREISSGSRVLDIGCFDGALFHLLGRKLASGIGVDPLATPGSLDARFELRRGTFPAVIAGTEPFDAITLLAVLEHVPEADLPDFAAACNRHLRPGGIVVATVPAPSVDRVLSVLLALRLIDGMSLEEHHGFRPESTAPVFVAAGFELRRHRRFQLGLNHLFVFERRHEP